MRGRSTTLDSSSGSSIAPGSVLKDLPNIGVTGKERIRSVEVQVSLIEYSDGIRTGVAPDAAGAFLDSSREELAHSLSEYAETLRQSGPDGVNQRLREEAQQQPSEELQLSSESAATSSASAPKSACGASRESPALHLARLLGADRFVSLLRARLSESD